MKVSLEKRRGFTLVEIMVVSVLFMVLAGGLLTIYLTGQTSYISSDTYIQLQQESRRAFDNVVRELRESGSISCGSTAITGDCQNRRINFQIALGYGSSTPCGVADQTCWGSEDFTNNPWVHYIITGAGTNVQLVRCLSGSAAGAVPNATCAGRRVLANYVDGGPSIFNWDSTNQIVTITLQMRYVNDALPEGGQVMPPLSSQVKLRN